MLAAKTDDLLPASRDVAAPAGCFATVEVHRDAARVIQAWAVLESSAPCSIYQTRAWLLPWIDTLGRKAGLEPLFVLARASDGRPVALLCLGVIRKGSFRIARWLGGHDSNFNMPLTAPGLIWTPCEVQRLMREAATACGRGGPDVFVLVNQPPAWGVHANPLALLSNRPSPTPAFGTDLPRDAEALFAAKLSKDTRKKLRKKEAKLATLGAIKHLVVTDAEAQRRVIDSFLAQKVERFQARKIASEFGSPEMRAFIERASAPSSGGIELHALTADDRIVAIYGGASHGGQWSGMFNSFDGDETIARSSPGDLLLMHIIAKACADGLARFDLGIGEARYKAALCDDRLELFDTIVPVSPAGRLVAAVASIRLQAKRAIKANPRLYALAKAITARGT